MIVCDLHKKGTSTYFHLSHLVGLSVFFTFIWSLSFSGHNHTCLVFTSGEQKRCIPWFFWFFYHNDWPCLIMASPIQLLGRKWQHLWTPCVFVTFKHQSLTKRDGKWSWKLLGLFLKKITFLWLGSVMLLGLVLLLQHLTNLFRIHSSAVTDKT